MNSVTIQEYNDKKDYLTDYYATIENYIKEKDPSLLDKYKQYQDTRSFSEEKALLILNARENRKLKQLLERAGDLNKRARQKDQILDAVVSFWTQSTPQHPANKRLIRDGFLEIDIYIELRNPDW